MKISIILFSLVTIVGCSSEKEYNADESLAFYEKYESVWYPPKSRERYLEALRDNEIPFFEQESYPDSTLWINTERKYSEQVSKIPKRLFGTLPGEFSVSFLNKDLQEQAANALKDAGIKIEVGVSYGDAYIQWKETDTKLADEILLSQFGYDRERSIEAAKSHNK